MGHYICYNQFIIDNFKTFELANPNLSFYFLYNFEARLFLNFSQINDAKLFFLKDRNANKNKRQMRSSIFKEVIIHCKKIKIDHLLFMDLDKYQLPIFLSSIKFSISGILFRPHHRINASNKNILTVTSTSMRRLKKILLERLLLSRNFIQAIFILNDTAGVVFLNNKYKTNAFQYLPDPIFSYQNNKVALTKSVYIFLIFGAISERKNIINIIKAYDLATINFNSELQIIGPASPEFERFLETLIPTCKTINGISKTIKIKNEFVTDAEMETCFAAADICLLIYKDFFGSSGLLGRAALHGKKVIGANVGLIAEIINKYNLGTTCDPTDVNDIAIKLATIKESNFDDYNGRKFYEEHQPEKFLSALLNCSNKPFKSI